MANKSPESYLRHISVDVFSPERCYSVHLEQYSASQTQPKWCTRKGYRQKASAHEPAVRSPMVHVGEQNRAPRTPTVFRDVWHYQRCNQVPNQRNFEYAQRNAASAVAERATFDLNSDEGMALFASPNGLSVNWFLIHHAAVLGRREPRVTIFNSKGGDPRGEKFCMIWDLIPQGQEGSFGEVEKERKQRRKSGPRRRII